MLIPRQLEPTVGLSHNGFRFLEGRFEGLEGYDVGRMTKSRRGKLYIDDAGWGPEADSIEYGYRVPFGSIHVFISKIGEPGPEPDICTDIVETAQRAQSARVKPAMKRAFVGMIHGGSYEDGSELHGATAIRSGRRFVTGTNDSRPAKLRSVLITSSMDDSHEGTLHGRFNPGGSRTLSRLDEVGADVRLRAQFTDRKSVV